MEIDLYELSKTFKKLQNIKINSPDDKNALYKHAETLCGLFNGQDRLKHPYFFNIENANLSFKNKLLFFTATKILRNSIQTHHKQGSPVCYYL